MKTFSKFTDKTRGYITYGVLFLFTMMLASQVSQSRVLDGALGLSGLVKYPTNSLMSFNYEYSWSLAEQVVAVLISIGLSNIAISFGFSVLINVGLPSVLYLISRAAGMNRFWSLAIAILTALSISPINLLLRSDYPLLLGSSWTHGELGVLFATAIFTAIVYEKFKIAGLLAGLFVAVHAVWGIYALIVLIIPVTFKWLSFTTVLQVRRKELGIYGLIGLAISSVSFVNYLMNKTSVTGTNSIDQNSISSATSTYWSEWDFHRNIPLQLIPVFLSLVLAGLLYLGQRITPEEFRYSPQRKMLLSQMFVLTLICSTAGYLLIHIVQTVTMKLWPANPINFLIPGRFMNLHAFLAFPLLYLAFLAVISFFDKKYAIRKRFTELSGTKKFIVISLPTILVASVAAGSLVVPQMKTATDISIQQLIGRLRSFPISPAEYLINVNASSEQADFDVFCKIFNSNDNVLTIGSANTAIPRYCHQPVLLETSSIDVFAYTPQFIPELFDVIQNLYGIDPQSPMESRRTGGIAEAEVRSKWETRSSESWSQLACKYGFAEVATPSNWSLKIKHVASTNDINLFRPDITNCKI